MRAPLKKQTSDQVRRAARELFIYCTVLYPNDARLQRLLADLMIELSIDLLRQCPTSSESTKSH